MIGFLRPSDVERIDLNQCSLSDDKVLQLVVVAPKEKRAGSRITKAITIHPHSNELLCPVDAYQAYTNRIATSASNTPHPVVPELTINSLFRQLNDFSSPIGSQRISKHVQHIMKLVSRPKGAPIPKARALGATLAAQTGVPVDDIVAHGNWSSRSIFENFYRISVATSSDFNQIITLDKQQRSRSSKCNVM